MGEKMRSRRLLTIRSRRCLMSRNEAIKVLGLEKNFEKSELKSVYLEKAKLYHPDKSDTNPEYFEKIKEAYEFLENDKESSGTSKKSNVADKKWKEYTEQEIKLKENYLKWKQKQLEKGAKEENLLTEEQYISQARGVQAAIMNFLKRIALVGIAWYCC